MVKVIAIICSIASGLCHEETVTTSDMSGVGMQACQIGQPALVDWMKSRPQYRLAGWKCQIGNRGNAA
jgi:hypothetical protein